MGKYLPEIIFGSSDSSRSKEISRLHRQGLVRKMMPRVYTSNLIDSDEAIIKRNLWIILGHLYPGAVLSHRSALEGGPTPEGHIFLTYKYKKIVNAPGFTIHLLSGPDPTSSDPEFIAGLYISSQARAFLENLQESRQSNSTAKILARTVIEDRLDQICRIKGEDALNQLRDEALNQANDLGMHKAYQELTQIISAILSTHPDTNLHSPLSKARAQGWPYDPQRLELLASSLVD